LYLFELIEELVIFSFKLKNTTRSYYIIVRYGYQVPVPGR